MFLHFRPLKLALPLALALFLFAFPQMGMSETKQFFDLSGSVVVTRVSDGDSLRSGKLKIRLFGIDAPEIKQQCKDARGDDWPCGKAAKQALQNIVDSADALNCKLHDVDRYGRLIMQCFAGDTDIGAALVGNGHALAYRDYSTAYVSAETSAANAKLGIWRGSFMPPWEWRRQ